MGAQIEMLSVDPDTDHPIAGDTVVYTADNDAVFGGTVEEGYADRQDSTYHRFRIIGHAGLFLHETDAWRSRIISRPAPEPEPEPEWKPGTSATADVWTNRTEQRLRVFRIPGAWIDEHGEIWHDVAPDRHVDEIVPDAPDRSTTTVKVTKTVTRELLADALARHYGDHSDDHPADPSTSENYRSDADAILALLGGAR